MTRRRHVHSQGLIFVHLNFEFVYNTIVSTSSFISTLHIISLAPPLLPGCWSTSFGGAGSFMARMR